MLTWCFKTKHLLPSVRRKDKKFTFLIWCIGKKIRLQKVGVVAGFWVSKKKLFLISGTFKFFLFTGAIFERIFPPRGKPWDLDESCFPYTFGPTFMPPIHFWRRTQKKLNHFYPTVPCLGIVESFWTQKVFPKPFPFTRKEIKTNIYPWD